MWVINVYNLKAIIIFKNIYVYITVQYNYTIFVLEEKKSCAISKVLQYKFEEKNKNKIKQN